MSSAKHRAVVMSFSVVLMLSVSASHLTRGAMNKSHLVQDRGSPCLIPRSILNGVVRPAGVSTCICEFVSRCSSSLVM